MSESLHLIVQAVNRTHAWSNELHETLHKLFIPFLGKKVVRVNGAFTANVNAALPVIPNNQCQWTRWENTPGAVCLVVNVREHVPPDKWVHQGEYLYLGELRDQVLVRVLEPTTRRTDWTVDDVLRKRVAYKQAQKALDDCESALYPFSAR